MPIDTNDRSAVADAVKSAAKAASNSATVQDFLDSLTSRLFAEGIDAKVEVHATKTPNQLSVLVLPKFNSQLIELDVLLKA